MHPSLLFYYPNYAKGRLWVKIEEEVRFPCAVDVFDYIREGMARRYFRATRKLNAPNLVSHITQRAAGREPLFLEDSDFLFMLGVLKEIADKYLLRVYAFCLMPNHIHLLLSPREGNLYEAMRDLFSRYAMKFNRKYERKGHLFGGPYRQAVCLNDGYLLAASLYIHLNPVRTNLAKWPLGYRWSSCRLYCEDDAPRAFVDPSFILGLLAGDKAERKEKYRILVERGSGLKSEEVLEQEKAIERFRSKLTSLIPSIFKQVEKGGQVAASSGVDMLALAELEGRIETLKNTYTRNLPENKKAKRYLIEQLIARGFKKTEIAERLGIARKTVYNILKSPSYS